MWKIFDDGWALGDQRVGPIPPGEYLITATAEDGRSSAQWVSVLGEELQTVDLLLVGGD